VGVSSARGAQNSQGTGWANCNSIRRPRDDCGPVVGTLERGTSARSVFDHHDGTCSDLEETDDVKTPLRN
jgi:hypothetical protein